MRRPFASANQGPTSANMQCASGHHQTAGHFTAEPAKCQNQLSQNINKHLADSAPCVFMFGVFPDP